MTEVLWVGNCASIPSTFAGSDEFTVRCVPADQAADALADAPDVDCVIYDPEGDSEQQVAAVLEAVCDQLSEAPCVVAGTLERVPDDVYVFDHVPKNNGWVEVLSEVVGSAVEGRSHTSYPVPEDEDRRLREVKKVGELDIHGDFDRITEIGRYCFDADMCFVGMVDNSRELFLSCRGASLDELPREQSVCTYQILDEGVTVVRDILDDPRFESRERLRELGMRFYAGAPITTDSGVRIGSFCIMDSEPRDIEDEDRRMLTKFGEEVAEKIRLLRGQR